MQKENEQKKARREILGELVDKNKILVELQEDIDQETPFYTKHIWIPFVAGGIFYFMVNQAIAAFTEHQDDDTISPHRETKLIER